MTSTRSLFRRVVLAPPFSYDMTVPMSQETAAAIFAQFKARAVVKEGAIEATLADFEARPATAVTEPQAERALEYDAKIRDKADRVRCHLKPDEHGRVTLHQAEQAVVEAIGLAMNWMQLLADTRYAPAVWAKEHHRLMTASAVSDEAILAAVARHKFLKAAARELGLSDRQLHARRQAIKGRTS